MTENYWKHLQCQMLHVKSVCLPQQSAAAELWHHLTSAAVSLTEFQQTLTLSSDYQQQIYHCSCPHNFAKTNTAHSAVRPLHLYD